MADFEVIALDHVNITAPPELIDETASWYRDTFGLDDVEKPEGTRAGGAWLRASTTLPRRPTSASSSTTSTPR
jgi:catechol 2,3-dioxygenase-like lactoylglutathione lyase family enzyme